ncbi:hypothetical protein GCM10009818_16070 [Nakamurella flavida]
MDAGAASGVLGAAVVGAAGLVGTSLLGVVLAAAGSVVGVAGGVEVGGGVLVLARTPVKVGAADPTAAAVAVDGSSPEERELRAARNQTTPISTTTAAPMARIRRSQYTVGERGPTGCITRATVVCG